MRARERGGREGGADTITYSSSVREKCDSILMFSLGFMEGKNADHPKILRAQRLHALP